MNLLVLKPMTKPYKYLMSNISFHFLGCHSHFFLFLFSHLLPVLLSSSIFPIRSFNRWMNEELHCITTFTRRTLVITPHYEIILIRLAQLSSSLVPRMLSSVTSTPYFLTLGPGDWRMMGFIRAVNCICGPAASLGNMKSMGEDCPIKTGWTYIVSKQTK